MRIATENKAEGQGVGRFGALQIGKWVKIETAAYDKIKKKYTRTSVEMTADNIVSSKNLEELEFPIGWDSGQTLVPTLKINKLQASSLASVYGRGIVA